MHRVTVFMLLNLWATADLAVAHVPKHKANMNLHQKGAFLVRMLAAWSIQQSPLDYQTGQRSLEDLKAGTDRLLIKLMRDTLRKLSYWSVSYVMDVLGNFDEKAAN